jgi:hypothetical protein
VQRRPRSPASVRRSRRTGRAAVKAEKTPSSVCSSELSVSLGSASGLVETASAVFAVTPGFCSWAEASTPVGAARTRLTNLASDALRDRGVLDFAPAPNKCSVSTCEPELFVGAATKPGAISAEAASELGSSRVSRMSNARIGARCKRGELLRRSRPGRISLYFKAKLQQMSNHGCNETEAEESGLI